MKKNQNTCEEIENAIAANDLKSAHRIAHTLKGVAGLLGATELHAMEAIVENLLSDGDIKIAKEQMESLKRMLLEVFAEVEANVQNENIEDIPSCELDKEKALKLIETLEPLLAKSNTKSMDLLPEIRELLVFTTVKGALLAEQVEEFDFKPAYQTIQEMKQQLL